MAIARIAEAAGMTCYVGCMIETSLGTAAYLQVALAAAPVTWGCELFGPCLLEAMWYAGLCSTPTARSSRSTAPGSAWSSTKPA